MSKLMQCLLGVAVLLLPAIVSSAQAGDAFSERIHFVQQDGRRALVYTTSRTDYEDYNIWFKQKDSYKPEDYLKDFLYLFPKSGESMRKRRKNLTETGHLEP